MVLRGESRGGCVPDLYWDPWQNITEKRIIRNEEVEIEVCLVLTLSARCKSAPSHRSS
jgi:hypothetical protein